VEDLVTPAGTNRVNRRAEMTATFRLIVALLAAGAAPLRAQCAGSTEWSQLITAHLARYPLMELPDLYKLLLQATMGNEHALGSPAMIEDWMHRDLAAIDSEPGTVHEPLVDSLGHPARYARVHLRPFVARGGNSDSLTAVFIASPRVAPPDTTAMRCATAQAERMARIGSVPWGAAAVRTYFAARAAAGYPAVDHSAAYERAYHPAYRVVATVLLPRLLGRH
jgi:hypothetical protein